MKESTVRAVVLITGNGGGLLRVVRVDIPRTEWENEPREWVDAQGIARTLDGSEGYELMTAEQAMAVGRDIIRAAGGAL